MLLSKHNETFLVPRYLGNGCPRCFPEVVKLTKDSFPSLRLTALGFYLEKRQVLDGDRDGKTQDEFKLFML